MSAGPEALSCPSQLHSVVLDMFEYIEVNERIKRSLSLELFQRTDHNLTRCRQLAVADRLREAVGERWIGLEADPTPLAAMAQQPGRAAQPSPNFQDFGPQIRLQVGTEIRFPVGGGREQVQLAAYVGVVCRHC